MTHPDDDPIFALADEQQQEFAVLSVKIMTGEATDADAARCRELFHLIYPDGDVDEFLSRFRQVMDEDDDQ